MRERNKIFFEEKKIDILCPNFVWLKNALKSLIWKDAVRG
jgi:hypothetical protein